MERADTCYAWCQSLALGSPGKQRWECQGLLPKGIARGDKDVDVVERAPLLEFESQLCLSSDCVTLGKLPHLSVVVTLAENEKIFVYQVVPFWVQVTKKTKTNKNKNPQTSPTNEGCILAHIWKSPEIYRLQARLDLEARLHPQHSDSISGILSSMWLCSQARCSHTVADTHQHLQF